MIFSLDNFKLCPDGAFPDKNRPHKRVCFKLCTGVAMGPYVHHQAIPSRREAIDVQLTHHIIIVLLAVIHRKAESLARYRPKYRKRGHSGINTLPLTADVLLQKMFLGGARLNMRPYRGCGGHHSGDAC